MNVAIIDDSPVDRACIARCMRRYKAETPSLCIAEFPGGSDFIRTLSKARYDLVLLDCCMNGLDGLQTAHALRQHDPQAALVFITSSRDYAVDGYRVSASGYLVKPFTYEGFVQALTPALGRLLQPRAFLNITGTYGDEKVFLDDIVYCDIDGHYVQLHLNNASILRVRMTFVQLSAQLSMHSQFLECYRGCIINMDRARAADDLNFLMDSGDRVPFRKKEQGKLMHQFHSYLFEKSRMGGAP